jgi:hypothetical protein
MQTKLTMGVGREVAKARAMMAHVNGDEGADSGS